MWGFGYLMDLLHQFWQSSRALMWGFVNTEIWLFDRLDIWLLSLLHNKLKAFTTLPPGFKFVVYT